MHHAQYTIHNKKTPFTALHTHAAHTRVLFFSREIGFRLKYFVIASESNGYRPGRACVAAHRTGIWACQGHDPLFLWLRWVEVSPKRLSLHARYSFYPSKYAASPQVAKVCVPLFLFSRRKEGDQGVAPQEGEMAQQDEDVQMGTPLR